MISIRSGLLPPAICVLLAAMPPTLTAPADARAAARNCSGYVYTAPGPAGVSVRRGATSCRTAKRILRAYLTSNAPLRRLGLRAPPPRLDLRQRRMGRVPADRQLRARPEPPRRRRHRRLTQRRARRAHDSMVRSS